MAGSVDAERQILIKKITSFVLAACLALHKPGKGSAEVAVMFGYLHTTTPSDKSVQLGPTSAPSTLGPESIR